MRHLTLILTIIFFQQFSLSAQTSVQLDEKNGFKDIKLGDDFTKWSSNLVLVKTLPDNESIYKYTGTCCHDVFSTPVETIEIMFANNKIVYIGVYLKPYQDNRSTNSPAKFRHPNDDFTKLTIDFKSLFGEPKEGAPNEPAGIMYSRIWEGQKVILIADYYFMGSYDYSKVIVMDKIYFKKKKEKGF